MQSAPKVHSWRSVRQRLPYTRLSYSSCVHVPPPNNKPKSRNNRPQGVRMHHKNDECLHPSSTWNHGAVSAPKQKTCPLH